MLKSISSRFFHKENYILFLPILFLVCLAYGLLIPWLGFYWDDWCYFYEKAEFARQQAN
jgi:hypothetical protein